MAGFESRCEDSKEIGLCRFDEEMIAGKAVECEGALCMELPSFKVRRRDIVLDPAEHHDWASQRIVMCEWMGFAQLKIGAKNREQEFRHFRDLENSLRATVEVNHRLFE